MFTKASLEAPSESVTSTLKRRVTGSLMMGVTKVVVTAVGVASSTAMSVTSDVGSMALPSASTWVHS